LRFVPIENPRHLEITKGSEQAVMSAQIEWFRLRILTAIIVAASILTRLCEEQIPKLNHSREASLGVRTYPLISTRFRNAVWI
jgi:hypothetical protein